MRDTILIVEDDEMICQGIVDALQLRNWKTDVAATCEEAEKKIKEYTYMLYILDMKLPDGNGISLCRKIRTATAICGSSTGAKETTQEKLSYVLL